MNGAAIRRPVLLLVASLAVPAAAQPTPHVQVTPKWRSWPGNSNWLLQFTDSAEIWVDVELSPPIGSLVSYTAPPGNGTGTLAGLAVLNFEIRGCDMVPGPWTLSGPGFHGTTGTTFGNRPPWTLGSPGDPQANSDVLNIQPAMFVGPGIPPNPSNPITELWRGKWVPQPWQPGRTLRFSVVPVSAHVGIHYDTVNGVPQYWPAPATVSAGQPIEIFLDMSGIPPCFPVVMQQPQNASVAVGGAVMFSATVIQEGTNCSPLSYQWRRDCVPLSNGPRISGANTPQLTINPVIASDGGRYDLYFGNHTHTALLTVSCYANCDNSTAHPVLNVADFSCFLGKFAAADPYANCDGSQILPVLNIADFACFLTRFAAGCP